MSRFIYNIIISIYHFVIRLASLFNPKAKAWVVGRENNIQNLVAWRKNLPIDTPLLWMHCASLGEFEQGRPVLEQIRKDFPHYKIALTFYSPSGYEQRKNYERADWIGYLPADGKIRAKRWLGVLQPTIAVFVKYEFWVEHLNALFVTNIPTFLIAASFRKDQLFFKWYGGFFRKTLGGFQHIFTQSLRDVELLKGIGIQNISLAGDPRIDRVLKIASTPRVFNEIVEFKNNEKLLIAGSSWAPDENIILDKQEHWEVDWKLLLVPHEVGEKNITRLCNQLQIPFIRYSKIDKNTDLAAIRIMILDEVGMLSQVYRYGNLAYIGGGFGVSIHNTLEPAAFGLPIIMGPKIHKFPEATAFVKERGAFVVHNAKELQQNFLALKNDIIYENASSSIQDYIARNKGATNMIVEGIRLGL